jgi:hypothetical protein
MTASAENPPAAKAADDRESNANNIRIRKVAIRFLIFMKSPPVI